MPGYFSWIKPCLPVHTGAQTSMSIKLVSWWDTKSDHKLSHHLEHPKDSTDDAEKQQNANDNGEEARQTHLTVSSKSLPWFRHHCTIPTLSSSVARHTTLLSISQKCQKCNMALFKKGKPNGGSFAFYNIALSLKFWVVVFAVQMSLEQEVSIGLDLGWALRKVHTTSPSRHHQWITFHNWLLITNVHLW